MALKLSTCVAFTSKCILQIRSTNNTTISLFNRCYVRKVDKIDESTIPKGPKQPLNPYLTFSQAHYEELKQKNKDASLRDISKMCGEMWRELDKKTKEEYTEAYKERQAAYKEQVQRFNESLTEEDKKLIGQLKLQKAKQKFMRKKNKFMTMNNCPKQPGSSFFLYVKSQKMETDDIQGHTKQMAENWKQMTAEEKKPYEEQSKIQREQYEKDIADWVVRMVEESNGKELIQLDKALFERVLKRLGFPNKPQKAYNLYRSELHVSQAEYKEHSWSSLDNEEKKKYKELAEMDKDRYKEEFENFYVDMKNQGRQSFVDAVLQLIGDQKKISKGRKRSKKVEKASSETTEEGDEVKTSDKVKKPKAKKGAKKTVSKKTGTKVKKDVKKTTKKKSEKTKKKEEKTGDEE